MREWNGEQIEKNEGEDGREKGRVFASRRSRESQDVFLLLTQGDDRYVSPSSEQLSRFLGNATYTDTPVCQ